MDIDTFIRTEILSYPVKNYPKEFRGNDACPNDRRLNEIPQNGIEANINYLVEHEFITATVNPILKIKYNVFYRATQKGIDLINNGGFKDPES